MARIIRIVNDSLHWSKKNQLAANKLLGVALDEFMPNKSGKLSVFRAETEDIIIRIVTAFLIGKSSIDDGHYLSIDEVTLEAAFRNVKQIDGKTADKYVNSLHHDIEELYAEEVLRLAIFFRENGEPNIIPLQEIAQHTAERLDARDINVGDIKIKSQPFFDELLLHIKNPDIYSDAKKAYQAMKIRKEIDKKLNKEQRPNKLEEIKQFIDKLDKLM